MKEWIKRTLSESDGSPSIKRQSLAITLIVVSSICISSFIMNKPIDSSLVTMLQSLLGISGLSYTIARFSENKDTTNG